MKKLEGFEEAYNREEYRSPSAGAYICKIVNVTDMPSKELLKFEFEIMDGEFTGYAKQISDKYNFWPLTGIASYKTSAMSYFARFLKKVEESNPGYKWDNNELSLRGKLVGVVFKEREYIKKTGKTGTSLREDSYINIQDVQNGNYKVPEREELKVSYDDYKNNNPIELNEIATADGELPF